MSNATAGIDISGHLGMTLGGILAGVSDQLAPEVELRSPGRCPRRKKCHFLDMRGRLRNGIM
jgi:hypothetical protein